MSTPSVYAYLDYRAFLADWFAHRKSVEPRYSYATFSKAAGCSRSALANVLSGSRTPRAASLDAFARGMELTPSERNYLGLLVELSTARDTDARHRVMDRILASERYRQFRHADGETTGDVGRYLEHWYVPAIRELAALPGFRCDAEWVASRLRPTITVEQAQTAIDTLFELDFLHRTEDGEVETRLIRFSTGAETQQVAAAHFHSTAIPQLLGAIDARQGAEQHLLAATLTLSPGTLPEIKARLSAVFEQVATLADADESEDRRVYQFALQLLPVTDQGRD